MKTKGILATAIAVLALGLVSRPTNAQCGGICVYEVATPDMARSYAGAGAAAQYASTAYTNSAGMTRLDQSQVQLGGFLAFIDQRLNLDDTTVSVPPGSTDGGGQIGGFLVPPGGGAYGVLKLDDDLRLGFTFNGPYGGGVDYGDDWVGKNFVTENTLLAFNFMPSTAYRLTDWLSFGVGLNILYTFFDQELRARLPGSPKVKLEDADGWALGYTLSTLLEPRKGTRIGIVYRSEIDTTLEGTLDNPTPLDANFDLTMNFPQGVNVSLFQQVTPNLALLADGGWSDWSVFTAQSLSVGPITIPIDRGWRDTWRAAIGFQYKYNDPWLFQGGFSYDSSPVSASKRTPDIPVGEGFRYSVGFEYKLNERMTLGSSYTFAWFGNGDVDNVALPPNGNVVLDGDYSPNSAHFLGFTFKWKFGTESLASKLNRKNG